MTTRAQLVALLSPEQFERLKALSLQSRISMSEYVRQALSEWFERREAAEREQQKAGAA